MQKHAQLYIQTHKRAHSSPCLFLLDPIPLLLETFEPFNLFGNKQSPLEREKSSEILKLIQSFDDILSSYIGQLITFNFPTDSYTFATIFQTKLTRDSPFFLSNDIQWHARNCVQWVLISSLVQCPEGYFQDIFARFFVRYTPNVGLRIRLKYPHGKKTIWLFRCLATTIIEESRSLVLTSADFVHFKEDRYSIPNKHLFINLLQ